MGKLKNAVIEARELAETHETNEALLWRARDALSLAISAGCSDPWGCLSNSNRALSLLNTYLMEVELCKR